MQFGDLISPIDERAFFQKHWENSVAEVKRGNPGYFSSLITTEDLDAAMRRHLLGQADCRAVRKISSVPPDRYTFTDPPSMRGRVDPSKVHQLLTEGVTFIFESVHTWHPPLNNVCLSILKSHNLHSQCNIYATPQGSYGFGPHFDTHDVLILQISGRKAWSIYDFEIGLPLPSQARPLGSPPRSPSRKVVLEPGDTLYVPRGLVHDADSLDELSIHITLGVFAYTWKDLLTDALTSACEKNQSLRRCLPNNITPEEAIQSLPERVALVENAARMILNSSGRPPDFQRRGTPVQEGSPLLSISNPNSVQPNSLIEIRKAAEAELIRRGEAIILDICGHKLSFPEHVEDTIKWCVSQPRFSVSEIPGLDEESQLVLATRLLEEGVAWIIAANAGSTTAVP